MQDMIDVRVSTDRMLGSCCGVARYLATGSTESSQLLLSRDLTVTRFQNPIRTPNILDDNRWLTSH